MGKRTFRRVRVYAFYGVGITMVSMAVLVPFVLQRHVDQHSTKLDMNESFGAVGSKKSTETLPSARVGRTKAATFGGGSNSVLPSIDTDDDVVHIVFSTDCSGYQHWQSIALWYASRSAGHPGPVTRIASGCSDERQRREIEAEWNKIDGGRDLFRVHFTPDMKLKGKYKYSNKPGGLRHWLNHADPKVEEEYVVLLDPDMLPLLPITTRLGAGLDRTPRKKDSTNQLEYVERSTGIARLLRVDDTELLEVTDYVRPGRPAGQHFGLGGTWAFAAADSARYPQWINFSKAAVCGEASPCTTTSVTDAKKKYAVGPVYLAHIDDWKRIADAWWESMSGVHSQHPYLLAEMFALTIAVANLTLPWTLVSSYMVTGAGVHSPTEAWSWIDDISRAGNATSVCNGAAITALPFVTRNRSAIALPTTLHYCQRYQFLNHLFAKRKVAHDFFRCDGYYIPFDVEAILRELSKGNLKQSEVRNAFMICHLIPMMNSALDSYKRDVCDS